MELTEDQLRARNLVSVALRAVGIDTGKPIVPDDPAIASPVIAIVGRAGSGKSALLADTFRMLADAGLARISGEPGYAVPEGSRTLAVLAPTNKAAGVLRNMGVPATTIHRVLYTPVYSPEYEAVARWLSGRGDRPTPVAVDETALERARTFFTVHPSVPGALASAGIRWADFIEGWKRRDDQISVGLVDEASMLDEQQFEDLKAIFETLILFGDPGQLAPVGGNGRMVFDKLPQGSVVQLRRIHRQSSDSPVLKLAHALGDPDLDFKAFDEMVRDAAASDTRVIIAPRADAEMMARAPVLVWRNSTRVRLINAFRSAYDAPADRLLPGEPLVCDGLELSLKHRKRRADLEARGLIKGTFVVYLGPGKKAGFSRIHLPGSDEPQVGVASIIHVESPVPEKSFFASAAGMGAVFLHGAAVTIHKAQGSQWQDVQVFAPDLHSAALSDREEAGVKLWKRLAYVAVTRAQDRLFWVTRYSISRPTAELSTRDLK